MNLRKKSETITEKACREIAGFSESYNQLEQKIILSRGI
jgi:hypothetical protein